MQWLKRKKRKGALFKIGFRRAYDSIRWTFLEYMLIQVGVGPRMVKWIIWCVKTVAISIMINGSPSQPFKPHKGLRQGDHISPFLFTIVGEALSYILNKAKQVNLIRGIKVGKDNIEFSHLQLADDTLLFIPQDSCVVINYQRLLDCFGLMSGLKVNFRSQHWCPGKLTPSG